MLEKVKSEWQKWMVLTPPNALYDRTLVWLFIVLLVIGFVMVTSASIPLATRVYQDPFYFAKRDVIFILGAITICWLIVIRIPLEIWEKYNVPLLLITLVLQVVVIFIGKNVNGATRWIPIGSFNIQPSEIAKIAVICYFSSFYVRKLDEMRKQWHSSFRPIIVFLLFVLLLIKGQSDVGSTVVIFAIIFGMLFIVGAKLKQFFGLAILAIIGMYVIANSADYRIRRWKAFLDPFADVQGDGFQLANSQMAFGQGELLGKGLGNSIQKLSYLPEAHTDFIMAVIAEEFGLIGIVIIVLLLIALTIKALTICRESLLLEERFKGFYACGIAMFIFVQGFINLGVASGLLPTKGLTFPLVSYGGSSLIIMATAIAILIRIDYENRLDRLGHTHLSDK